MAEKVDMAEVESFTLDHTAVKAPYVRLIAVEHGPQGGVISNFDVRLVQPNHDSIETGGLHTIEHLLAGLLRTRLDGVIDCSPFGCRTGFHLITWGEPSVDNVAAAVKASLAEIAENVTWEDVPGTTAFSCGNYKDHSLHSAKAWSAQILAEGISVDAFERRVI
jgi:S-ribosylhomocysteine lyase